MIFPPLGSEVEKFSQDPLCMVRYSSERSDILNFESFSYLTLILMLPVSVALSGSKLHGFQPLTRFPTLEAL